ncbi:hypothetical protein R3P38DRAFT_1186174 [Favolaschia claudopus]|uniref:Uncharacterized protein n=1 Tax=Favolaschia claudopus TaxID=2862362 RepID=A0AAW0E2G3_9AGAR
MMTEIARLEHMDSQRFDISKSKKNIKGLGLCIIDDRDSEDETNSSRSSSPLLSTPNGSYDFFPRTRGYSPNFTDSATNTRESSVSPPSSNSSIPMQDELTEPPASQTDVTFLATPPPKFQLLPRCFSRPSSPVTSRPNSPFRPISPINFSALNCFSQPDALEEEIVYMWDKRARELEGLADVKVQVHQEVATDSKLEPTPVGIEKVTEQEAFRRRVLEPTAVVSAA